MMPVVEAMPRQWANRALEGGKMSRCVLALALLFFAASAQAAAQKAKWDGVGWYVIAIDAFYGSEEIAAGPYSEKNACKVAEDRFNATRTYEYDSYSCEYLKMQPKSEISIY
jgi:hypothetical protein